MSAGVARRSIAQWKAMAIGAISSVETSKEMRDDASQSLCSTGHSWSRLSGGGRRPCRTRSPSLHRRRGSIVRPQGCRA